MTSTQREMLRYVTIEVENRLKVAHYSFRSVSRKFCPRVRLVLHATRVVDVARVAVFFKLRRDIHARAFVGLSASRAN
jgi:hypothetical protein